MPRTLPSMAGQARLVSLIELATALYIDNNRFEEVIACSDRTKRVRKSIPGELLHYKCPQRRCEFTSADAGDSCPDHPQHDLKAVYEKIMNPFNGSKIEKVTDMLVRNNFSYPNACERRGVPKAAVGSRQWGHHAGGCKENTVPRMPGGFVTHTLASDDIHRSYAHFKETQRHIMDGETGYYVDGKKIDDDAIAPWVPGEPDPKTDEEAVKMECHPYNPRLEDILYCKISGEWLRLKKPTVDEILAVAGAIDEWGEQLAG